MSVSALDAALDRLDALLCRHELRQWWPALSQRWEEVVQARKEARE